MTLIAVVLFLVALVLGSKVALGTSWAHECSSGVAASDEPRSSGQPLPSADADKQAWTEDEDVSPRRCLERLMHHFTYVE